MSLPRQLIPTPGPSRNTKAAHPDLYPHQCEGVDFLRERRRAMLLFDMGLGKTATAIRACNDIGAKRILVVCPAIACENWQREIQAWSKSPLDATIVSFDRARRAGNIGLPGPFDVLIVDEAQYLKTGTSKRTQAIYGPDLHLAGGIADGCERVWLLSGTIMPNNIGELWTHLHALWPSLIPMPSGRTMNYMDFIKHYTHWWMGDYGPVVRDPKKETLPKLKRFMATIALRRRLETVMPWMPPLRVKELVLSADKAAMRIIRDVERKLPVALIDALARVQAAPVHSEAWVEAMDALDALEPASQSTLRRAWGEAKAPLAAELIVEDLDSGAGKIIVFAWHTSVLDTLQARLATSGYLAVRVDGKTSSAARQVAIDQFQSNPAVAVFLGQIIAAGTAITLTAAHHVVFVEASWSPADILQAAKRAHRIGQTKPVLVRLLTLDGSLDEPLTRTLVNKTNALNQLWKE